jgi:hypothetical protein
VGGGAAVFLLGTRTMRTGVFAALMMIALAPASAEGRLGTLPSGRYLCELPGDAAGAASRPVEGEWFDIVNASSYAAEGGAGTYLLTGETVVFTRGPMRGARFERRSERTLRRLDLTGELAKLRCIRTGRSAKL